MLKIPCDLGKTAYQMIGFRETGTALKSDSLFPGRAVKEVIKRETDPEILFHNSIAQPHS